MPTGQHVQEPAQAFASAGNWLEDPGEALRLARTETKLILAYQPRQDESCTACTIFENEVLNTAEFAELASTLVPLLIRDPANPEPPSDILVPTKGDGSFPALAVLNSEGAAIYRLPPEQVEDVAGLQRAVWIASQYQRFAAAPETAPDGAEKKAKMEQRWDGLDLSVHPRVSQPGSSARIELPPRRTRGTYVIHGDFSRSLKSGDFVIFQPPEKKAPKKSEGAKMGASVAAASMGASMAAPSTTVPGEIGRAKLVDGKFTLEGDVDKIAPVYFYVLEARTWEGHKMGATKGQGFILEPGDLSLTMDDNHKPTISGGYFNDSVYGPWLHSSAYKDLQALIPLVFRGLPGESESEKDARIQMGLSIQQAMMDMEMEGRKKVALLHPDLLVRQLVIETAWLQGAWMLDGARVIHRLDPENEWAREYVKNGEARLAKRERNAQAGSIGGRYLPFAASSMTGEQLSLSQTCASNKYVLLEFWASWCGPCRNEIPHLKDAYEQYRDKGFEIFAYTLDDEKRAWETASAEEDLPWIDTGLGRRSDPVLLYEITGVPANYLIDGAKGTVVARNLRGKDLENKLRELLGDAEAREE